MTGTPPKALETRVQLLPECRRYYGVFTTLGMTRKYNEAGVQPLQPSEISVYLNEMGLKGEERERFFRVILSMDVEMMSLQMSKKKPI